MHNSAVDLPIPEPPPILQSAILSMYLVIQKLSNLTCYQDNLAFKSTEYIIGYSQARHCYRVIWLLDWKRVAVCPGYLSGKKYSS